MVPSSLGLSSLLPRLRGNSTVVLHSGSLFLEVWGGEGSSQVRLDGVAKIRTTGDRQDRSGLRFPECPVCLTFTCSSVNSSSGLLT